MSRIHFLRRSCRISKQNQQNNTVKNQKNYSCPENQREKIEFTHVSHEHEQEKKGQSCNPRM